MAIYTDEYDPSQYDQDLPWQSPGPTPEPVAPPPQGAGTTEPPPLPSGGTDPTYGLPIGGRTQDASIIRNYIAKWAGMPGADPSLAADPGYWERRILEEGGLGWDNLDYWQNAGVGPNAFFRNPNRESGNLNNDTRSVDLGDDWFAQNSPAPASYQSLIRPDYVSGAYTPGQWTETFKAPTEADLLADPGYLAGEKAMQRGLERSAAAKGSILSGGFVGRALPRALGEYAGSAYKDLVGRAFDTYMSRYGAFMDNEALKAGARGLNENTFQSDLRENQNTYANRYKSYRDTIADSFDLAKMGLDAALGTRY